MSQGSFSVWIKTLHNSNGGLQWPFYLGAAAMGFFLKCPTSFYDRPFGFESLNCTKTRPLLPKRGWGFVLFSALPPQRRRGPVPLCLGAKERRLRSFENRRLQSGHDHGPPHDGYFFFAAVRQFLSIRSARTPGMGRSVCAGDADRRDRNIWGCIGQKVEQTKRSQMPQAHAVLPQLVLLHRLDDLVQRRREGFPVLWQIPLELKRVRCA